MRLLLQAICYSRTHWSSPVSGSMQNEMFRPEVASQHRIKAGLKPDRLS
jgi:hypothetical protein